MDEILEKAKKIIKERERSNLCLDAGICPKCGEKVEYVTISSKKINWFLDKEYQYGNRCTKCDWNTLKTTWGSYGC